MKAKLIYAGLIGLLICGVSWTSWSQSDPILPDPTLTPGQADPTLTAERLCAKGFTTKSIRNVPMTEKHEVYDEYHLRQATVVENGHRSPKYEIDHLISLELGGTNDKSNLWPQSYISQPWNAHVKDRLENELHAEVCGTKPWVEKSIGILTMHHVDPRPLADAQACIAKDWITCYKSTFGKESP